MRIILSEIFEMAPIALNIGSQLVIFLALIPGSCNTYVAKKKYPNNTTGTLFSATQNSLPIIYILVWYLIIVNNHEKKAIRGLFSW